MGEFIAEVLVIWVLAYPGAFIRWVLHRGKVPYSVLAQEDAWYNATYVALLVVIVLVVAHFCST